MNLGKLAKRLQKELAANPKQAVVLGIGCLVAVWFWAPLLAGWVKPKAAPVAGAAPPPTAAAPAVPANPAASPAATAITWQQIRTQRMSDPLMQTATANRSERNPFDLPVAWRDPVANTTDDAGDSTTVAQFATESVAEEPVLPSPNLVLQSIVYGKHRRRAQINGFTVAEQDEIPLGDDAPATDGAICRVKTIAPRSVLVEFGGRQIQLELQTKPLARGEMVERR